MIFRVVMIAIFTAILSGCISQPAVDAFGQVYIDELIAIEAEKVAKI